MMQIQQHLVAATSNAPMLEYTPWVPEDFVHPVRVKEGHMRTPQEPGAGTALKPDYFAKHRVC